MAPYVKSLLCMIVVRKHSGAWPRCVCVCVLAVSTVSQDMMIAIYILISGGFTKPANDFERVYSSSAAHSRITFMVLYCQFHMPSNVQQLDIILIIYSVGCLFFCVSFMYATI